MLEFKVTPNDMSLHIEADSLAQICTETIMAIRTIYDRLGGDRAEMYKVLITEHIGAAFETDSELDKRIKRVKDVAPKPVEALKTLNAAIEALEKAMDTDAD